MCQFDAADNHQSADGTTMNFAAVGQQTSEFLASTSPRWYTN